MTGANERRGFPLGKFYKVEKIVVHEKYKPHENAYDVAVVQIKNALEFSNRTAITDLSTSDVVDDMELTMSGWGNWGLGYPPPQRLQVLEVKAITTENCRKKVPIGVHDSQFCTVSKRPGRGACHVHKFSQIID